MSTYTICLIRIRFKEGILYFLYSTIFFMMKFTTEELVKYLYNESSQKQAEKIKSAVQTDWNLRDCYEKLLNTKNDLSELSFSPRRQSVNKILEYASKKHIHVS